MRFYETRASNHKLGLQTRVWLPYKHDFEEISQRDPESTISAMAGNRLRVLQARPVQMMIEFNSTLGRREQLGHDCAVFALACATGNAYGDTVFNKPGGSRVVVSSYTLEEGEPEINVGQPGYTTGAVQGAPRPFVESPHLFVRATADQGQPLHLSKLGSGENEMVVLSDFEAIRTLYPVKSSGAVLEIHEEPFDSDGGQANA